MHGMQAEPLYSPTVIRDLNEFSACNPALTKMIWDHIDDWTVQSETDKIIPFYTALIDARNQGMSDNYLIMDYDRAYAKVRGMGR